jgi:hypothetical protein
MSDLPADYMERQARWVKRMQAVGALPPDPEPEPSLARPPEGQWSMTSMPDGQVFVQINSVLVSQEGAIELLKCVGRG